MIKYLKFLNAYSREIVREYMETSSRRYLDSAEESMVEALSIKLWKLSKNAIEKRFLLELQKEHLLLAYVRGESDHTDEIEKKREAFTCRLIEKGNNFIKEELSGLYDIFQIAIRQFFNSIEEFCERFEKDKTEIENTLLGGKTIHSINTLNVLLGDEHNHGRATTYVKTDVGRFIYRPRSMDVDRVFRSFFERFFPEVTKLPQTLVYTDYGYCEFVENHPASSRGEASLYYENLGALCAVSVLLRSRDLHLENIIASGIYPVPVDLEMMLSPLETGMKMGATPKDVNWENTVCGGGFLSYKVEGAEIGVLFSELDMNKSLPVIGGKKMTVRFFKKEFMKGFKEGYLSFLNLKEDICRFFTEMPGIKLRFLMRGTQAYATMLQKINSYASGNTDNLKVKVDEALTLGFDKLGEERRKAIIESEKRAIMERNVPMFYTVSNGHDLFDGDGPVYDNYFDVSPVEHFLMTVDQASERELQFELDILERAISRELYEEKKSTTNGEDFPALSGCDYEKAARKLAENIINDAVYTDKEDMIWFSINRKYTMSMNYAGGELGRGSMGIALFFAALYHISSDASFRRKMSELIDRLMVRFKDYLLKIDSLDISLAENIISPSIDNGLAGIILANELIAKYTEKEICSEYRELCISILSKLDLRYCKTDRLYGCEGLLLVLERFESLLALPKVFKKAEEIRKILAERNDEAKEAGSESGEEKTKDELWPDLEYADGLWEGNCSKVDALINEGLRHSDAELLAEAGEKMHRVLERATANGDFTYVNEGFHNFFEASLANGAAGIGYTCLRLAYPGKIESLFL